jgi:hypothetical protein
VHDSVRERSAEGERSARELKAGEVSDAATSARYISSSG